MSNPFAAIEQSLNRASLGAVRNAVLAWGSLSARGVFGNEYTEILGMANTQPTFRCMASDLAGMTTGQTVTVDYADTATDYTVRAVEPDGTGLLRLVLEAA